MLLRRFGKCSLTVKLCLFRSYCLCLYMALHSGPSIMLLYCYSWNTATINVWRRSLDMLSITVLRMCHWTWDYLVLILLCIIFGMFLVFSGIRVLMAWLCTIETYIWIFLHSSDCVSVCLVCIFCHLPVVCPLFTMDLCGLK